MSAQERINIFCTNAWLRHRDVPSFNRDDRNFNLLTSSLRAWSRYYGFLEIIRSRYEQISAPYIEAVQLQAEKMFNAGQPSPRIMTQEEILEEQHLAQVGLGLHLEIESFYVFADILFDRIASTCGFYFWGRPKWKHKQFIEFTKDKSQKKARFIIPPEILTLPADLQKHVGDYRDDRITHVQEPRLHFATSWTSDKKTKISPILHHPKKGEVDSSQEPTGDIDEILALIDRYIIAMLDFFEANAEKSVFSPKIRKGQ